MLQEAERYYVKACHELRLLAAPLPFKVSQVYRGERSVERDSKLIDDMSNQHTSVQLPALPLLSARLSPPSSPKEQNLLSDDLFRPNIKELRQYETDDNTDNHQVTPKGLLPLQLLEKTNLTEKLYLNKREIRKENKEAVIKFAADQVSPKKHNVMSLEYDIRRYINDVRVQQSQLTLRGTSSGSVPIDRSLPPTPPPSSSSSNPSNPTPIRSKNLEDRIQKGRLREWKRERFCNRKYKELCNEVLAELEDKDKMIASIKDKKTNRLCVNGGSNKVVKSMSPILE